MSSPLMTSSSPQWDSRNRGFISPAELQQLRQASPGRAVDVHDFTARLANDASVSTQAQDNSTDNQPPTQPRPMPPSSQSHARTSSFFSFRSKPHQDHLQDTVASSPSNSNRLSTPSTDFGGPAPQMGQSKSLGPIRSPSDQRLDQQEPAMVRRSSLSGGQPAPAPLHPEIRSVVQLTLAHARKVYFSGPLVKRLERQPDGQRPLKDEGWVEVWAQLGGTTLSTWDMREVEEANQQGREVPPTYFNTTDAFVQVLGSITVPGTDGQPPKKFTNVLTLNTAGSNLLLFSCPSTQALMSWATALRLSAWEKSRLEEIYTAHLIRITLPGGRETHSTLQRGRMEGWVRIRVAGQTDWKRMWMVVYAASHPEVPGPSYGDGTHTGTSNPARKKRMSILFSREHSEDLPLRPILSLYASSKPKDKKKALLTLKDVTQAFAVYPERPELINRSTLMKLEGLLGDEETAGGMRGREGWLLVMPELEAGNTQASEMLKWLVALHDAFELYGRPKSYTWDPRDPLSMMFAYPVGPARDLLFLDRELAETMDPRDDRTSTIRSRLLNVLRERMPRIDPQSRPDTPPSIPPLSIGGPSQQHPLPASPATRATEQSLLLPQLPSLSLDSSSQAHSIDSAIGRALTPITELNSAGESLNVLARAPGPSLQSHGSQQPASESDENEPLAMFVAGAVSLIHGSGEGDMLFDRPIASSPPPTSGTSRKLSGDSFGRGPGSRPDSKLSPSVENPTAKSQETSGSVGGVAEIMGVKLPFSPLTSPESPSFSTNSSMSVHLPIPGNQGSTLQSPGSPGKSTKSPSSSPTFSILTSPHSLLEKDLPSIQVLQTAQPFTSAPSKSLKRNPFNVVPPVPDKPISSSAQSLSSTPTSKFTQPSAAVDPQSVFTDALFFMQQLDEKSAPPRRVPTTISEKSDSTSVSESGRPTHSPLSSSTSTSQPARSEVLPEPSLSGTRIAAVGRKPSGARALTGSGASRGLNPEGSSFSSPEQYLHRVPDSDTDTMSNHGDLDAAPASKKAQLDDVNADALVALSFLDADTVATAAVPKQPIASASASEAVQPPSPRPQPSPQPAEDPTTAGSSDNAAQFKSTFAPSKQAVQRKARLQAQQAAHQAAVHRPGRANGKRGSAARVSGWNETSDEDEEEDEDEDEDEEDADSDDEPSTTGSKRPSQASGQTPSPAPAPVGATPIRPLRPQSRTQSPAEVATATDANPYAQLRHPRNLPPVPRPHTQGTLGAQDDYFGGIPPQRRFVSDQRSRTPDEGAPPRRLSDLPSQPTPPRHSIWTQVLDASRQPGTYQSPPEASAQPQRDTFIQFDPASQSVTKAFTPHGLLSAGMQDKQDRSAKRQEELAREAGASLINVPNKPPPPQTGLLGAITAHERERKREGGVGAALTEREREKRLAEDRQRKLDEFQRQQLEMAQSGMFGGQFPMGMNPMMNQMVPLNPMMTGGSMMSPANPMVTGGFMGYPNMMPGYSAMPGYGMFAAQQAAQAAYQQAMMAFSTGGDVMRGPSPLTPMMTGGGMGFDPRMSMMGMPMMSPGMPMGGMGGGMGMMGGGMGGMGGMGMQMTGGSAFDARFSPPAMDDMRPPGAPGGQFRPGNHSSRNSSAGQGSPAGPRPLDTPDRSRDSPKT